MAKKGGPKITCAGCGADNDVTLRRCRLCGALINADVEDEGYKPKTLPEHIERQMYRDMGDVDEQPFDARYDFSSPTPPPADGAEPLLPPAVLSSHLPPPSPSTPPPPSDAAAFVLDSLPHTDDAEVQDAFDPDAFYREQASLPDARPRPIESSAPLAYEPDPMWSVGADLGPNPTTAEIEAAARAALREERLKKRPKIFDKVFKVESDADADVDADVEGATDTRPPPPLPPPPASSTRPPPPPPSSAPPPPPPPPPPSSSAPPPPPPPTAPPPPPPPSSATPPAESSF